MSEFNRLLSLARDLRARARQVLDKAETMQDADARQRMLKVGARYERLARGLEEEGGGEER